MSLAGTGWAGRRGQALFLSATGISAACRRSEKQQDGQRAVGPDRPLLPPRWRQTVFVFLNRQVILQTFEVLETPLNRSRILEIPCKHFFSPGRIKPQIIHFALM